MLFKELKLNPEEQLIRKNGWIRFLNVLIVLCISATALFSGLTVLPIPVGIIDTKLAGFLVIELYMFIIHLFIIAVITALLNVNKIENSSVMKRLLTFDIAFWVMAASMAFFLRSIAV